MIPRAGEFYRALFEQTREGIFLVDAHTGEILDVNETGARRLGYERRELIGRHIPDIHPSEEEARTVEARQVTLEAGGRLITGLRHKRKDGTLMPIEISTNVVEVDGRPCFLSVVLDVSERLANERERSRAYARLKRTQERLHRSEKLASTGMLLSGVAHEINNPIHVILGNLKLMRERLGALKRSRAEVDTFLRDAPRMAGDALRAAEQAHRVIAEFRAFARDPEAADPADLNACVDEALARLRAPAGVRVRRRAGRVPPVRCVAGQVVQAVLNLAKNAVEAMPDGGTLTVATRRAGRGAVEIVVTDTGRGIPRRDLPRVFEPFYTTKREGDGLGLGLPISATIAHNHGGRVALRSVPGRGTTATLRLPSGK